MKAEYKDESYTDDLKDFASNNKFQWFMIIIAILTLMRAFGMIPEPDFVQLLKYSIISVFGAEGLDQITNFRKGG